MPRASKPSYPSVAYMGEGVLIVAFGNRVSRRLSGCVYSLYNALRELALPGVTDLVPAYASLLVKFDPLRVAAMDLSATVQSLTVQSLMDAPVEQHFVGKRHVIPVRYGGEDGPDLEALAARHGVTIADAIKLHTSRAYDVYFLGFLPGFAYMGRVPMRLATPRLPTPRVKLPAGSVGIAGVQTSIYPFSSPGGWQIIGWTGVSIWDPNRSQPALFAPGDTVQFAATDEPVSTADVPATSRFEAQYPVFRVREPGALTTIQDLGRPGQAHLGLSPGGVCDPHAALRANALVGNRPDAALLEMTWTGPTMEAMSPTTIALDGSNFGCRVDGQLVTPGVAWFVRAGALVQFVQNSPSGGGARAYMAVAGGLDAPIVLGSRSTCLPAGFGGYEGRALRMGDVLGVVVQPTAPALKAGHYWMSRPELALHGRATIRFLRYSGVGSARPAAVRRFTEQVWLISPHSDRIGLRLKSGQGGQGIPSNAREAVSFGVVRGAIQLPPAGEPVVLNADHQTTGGYPLLGVVAQADWPILAQLQPGDEVRFQEINREEAVRELSVARNTLLAGLPKLGLGDRERDYALV